MQMINFLRTLHLTLVPKIILVTIAIIMGSVFIGCTGNKQHTDYGISVANSVFVYNGDVYVAGMIWRNQGIRYLPYISEAVLWKNGLIFFRADLNTSYQSYQSFKSVFVADDNLLLLGILDNKQTLWKNSTAQSLSDMYLDSAFSSIFVSEGDVYLAGTSRPNGFDNYVATFWKNGETHISDTDILDVTRATSVFVSGKDVYMAGYGYIFDQNSPISSILYVPRFWKNGVSQFFDVADNYYGIPNSLFVSDEDVYAVGEVRSHGAVIWKNGAVQYLTDNTDSYANSVFVSDNDVYVVGEVRGHGAVIWKNGVMRYFTNNTDSSANSVFVSGEDVYVAGTDNKKATLWKNGIAQRLPLE